MHLVIIGGTGHIGTFLAPRLVDAGHQVTCVTRAQREPYAPNPAWASVRMVAIDRTAEEHFDQRIAELRPDAVVDLICFTPESARRLGEALLGRVKLLLHCGTIWVHGHSVEVPTTEDQDRQPFGQYGIDKAAIECWLLEQARAGRLPASVLHPGHISGPGWVPINPAGHLGIDVFEALATGGAVTLPNLGMETLHHVHADDVAQAFALAVERPDAAIGESFHVVSPAALTLRGYAEAVAGWYGRTSNLSLLPWEQWKAQATPEQARLTWDHIAHSPCCSIDKARRLLGYAPRYTSLAAVREALDWLADHGHPQLHPTK